MNRPVARDARDAPRIAKRPDIQVVARVATIEHLTVDVTERAGALAVQLCRSRRDAPTRTFTVFADELDELIDALEDALDVIDPLPTPNEARAAAGA